MFGGNHGQHLRYLTRLTLCTRERRTPVGLDTQSRIFGIKFTYSQEIEGQSSMILGEIRGPKESEGSFEMNSLDINLDSQDGERLTKITRLTPAEERSEWIFALRVCINVFNRQHYLPQNL